MDYKVSFVASLEKMSNCFEREFETHEQAEAALNVIADYTLHLHKERLMLDHSNVGSVYKKMFDGSWEEIDGDGNEL